MKRLFFIGCFLLTGLFLFGKEDPIAINSEFTGQGFVFHNGKKEKIEANQVYYQNDSIVVTKPELKLLLLVENGKAYFIRKPGKYKLSSILNSLEAKPCSLSEQMLNDIKHHISLGHHKNKFSGVKMGGNFGGIVRNGPVCDSLICPRNNLHTDASSIGFSWKNMDGVHKYRFKLVKFSIGKELVYERVVNDTTFILNTSSFQWRNTDQYLWCIEPADTEIECEPTFYSFTLHTPKSARELKEMIIKDISKEEGDLIYRLKVIDLLANNGWDSN
ncbi:MAG: hypothetical protein IPK62_16155 [Bacteroidetes bacterium]|nr:hypothetical protein [Bacteroidota bacterium]MBK8146398.1 hypothetical protein [Bacteroidota bacterium]MBP6314803.1 hypothetical protein [Chitinophagaceae bacterium]